MGDIALLTVIGRLTKDATCEALPNNPGRFVVKWTTASSYYVRGQQDRPSAFYECRMFMGQERWNNVSQFLKKGRLVCVWGELRPRLTPDQQGGQKLWLNLEEVNFQPVGPKPEGQTSAPPQQGGGYPQQGGGYGAPAPAQTPPGAEPGLPQGWRQETDVNSGRPYYIGPNGQTQWEPPTPPPAAPPAAPPASPPPATPPPATPPGAQGGPPGYPQGGSPI